MNIVVQRAVGGAHQVDQTGLAEGDCVSFCKRQIDTQEGQMTM